ncbi:MAG: YsnF/AvaK domain-containing protein [Thermoproteota archaeon]|nr:YsnF/AvaK domain-containing protein [Thermoproteota archaeon]
MSDGNNVDNNIDWNTVLKKEAIGTGGVDLGEVYGVGDAYIITQKGLSDKKWYHIPKSSAESFDGNVLRLKVNESDLLSFEKTEDQETKDNSSSPTGNLSDVTQETETTVPLMGENLEVVKHVSEDDIHITKEPIRETKTVEIELTREEISIERRPVQKDSYSSLTSMQSSEQNPNASPMDGPVETRTVISIPLKREEPVITKTPYVKEEIVVKKKPVSETKSITEDITYERVKYDNKDDGAENT